MADLVWAVIVVGIATAATFIAAQRITRRFSRSSLLTVLLLVSAGLALYLQHGMDKPWVARLIPLSNAIILGNFSPLIAAVLAGTACNAISGAWWRKLLIPGSMVLLACWAAWQPLSAVQPIDGARLVKGIWRQTDQASCAPSAAATFLNAQGIAATQDEMARLCRTTDQGTATLGLYRGLVLKTAGTPWKVQVVTADTIAALRDEATSPIIINTQLRTIADVDPLYVTDWGWAPGVRHTVVLLEFIGNRNLVVADPAVGRERWDLDNLRVLWHGEGFQLVPR
jgi:hypothetical protein